MLYMDHPYLIRLLIGGAVIAGTTWIAEYFDPRLGGIISNIPSATIIGLLIIDSVLGEKGAVLYAKGVVIGNIPWFGYILSVILLTQRIGLVKSLTIGIVIWLLLVPVTWRIFKPV